MAFGGLGVMMFSGPPALWSINMAIRKVDIQSLFFASMFIVILVILAYLTNPSETSFRTFLTEQSFRHHLRRLDDDNQDDQSHRDDTGVHYTLSPRRPNAQSGYKHGRSYDEPPSSFHFANRASVALRTPKHLFQSFGIFTIAAIVPSGARSQTHHGRHVRIDGAGAMVSDSWYIGAFGKWWRGGALQSWWVETVANTKDAERCNSGILDVKSLDSLEGYDGLPVAAPPRLTNGKECVSPLRDTARSSARVPNSTPRSTTPPPLPKSASLPLHVPRVPTVTPAKGDKTSTQRHGPTTASPQQQAAVVASNTVLKTTPPQLQPSPSSLFDQNPVISELLRQISASKTAVVDMRTQLKDFQNSAAESHLAIQHDLDAQRERKRAEDAARMELKTRNKTLEESKRSAEAVKREADKKLKAAESARDKAAERIERIDKEIVELKEKMSTDADVMKQAKEDGDQAEEELAKQLELKKREVKVAEEVVAALNARAKELEEKIAQEEDLLRRAKEQADLRKQDRAFYPLHVVQSEEPSISIASPWSPLIPAQIPVQDPHIHIHSDLSSGIEVFPHSLVVPGTRARGASASSGSGNPLPTDFSGSPRPRKLSLGVLSNFHTSNVGERVTNELIMQRPKAYPSYEDTLPGQTMRFAPFGDSDVEVPVDFMRDIGAPSPKSSSLIPTSLIASLEGLTGADDLSRSFQSETDDILERDWRKLHPFPPQPVENPTTFSSSPTSLTHPTFDGVDKEDPFEIRPPPSLRHRLTSDMSDLQRANPPRSTSDPSQLVTMSSISRSRTHESSDAEIDDKSISSVHRRWFAKEKKGLNPEAKVFQFKKQFHIPAFSNASSKQQRLSTLDSLGLRSMPISGPYNATSLTTNMLPPPQRSHPDLPSSLQSDSVFSNLSMRAFAPSPAEREELARKLGSSANTSLERIPTLSEVSIASIPSSPNHVHAAANVNNAQNARVALLGGLPAWLAALPKVRKPKFSPWEDDVPSGTTGDELLLNGNGAGF
ncbi:hypothetical protein BXZ70DRAFT_1060625 [Cristinia sonorae]|uniref:Uncharacterized protein n=1 Tax=Cristinia sonorae TaxID=1940300 RepID=A0A8K0V085_9AGAR|nr:hypothetical protein BXZ70DRAFT_1060625 [Cristinia sonorae]